MSAAMSPARLVGLELIAEDTEASSEFYAWLVGGASEGDVWDTWQRLSGSGVRSVRVPEPEGPPPGWIPVFHVDDVRAAQQRAAERGGQGRDLRGPDGKSRAYCVDSFGVWTGLSDSANDSADAIGATNCDYSTADAPAAAGFYAHLLNARADAVVDDPYHFHLIHTGPVEAAGIVSFRGPLDYSRMTKWLVYLAVDDVDRVAARGIEAGARIVVPANNTVYNRYAVLEDPFGQLFGLSRPLPPESYGVAHIRDGERLVSLFDVVHVHAEEVNARYPQ
ncbi:VOC family protein [Arthrobacter sp. GCM10027362]|uniref:VOC family protein n=1 Tax=Arthrobacter sp. GCM10027362 TaxID=3273379 RepID=UPI0036354125